eukprot:CAMPEP_0172725222 /NCGR_PEP_ID=MMETSP1074-20121228/87868_1 /TAXON_ID=2916 /ORGANISM="Ceratium fusus, Strain PA161109" /LENGTH=73 /DNA_ID=CAMNT_0013551939 /DNA_START=26 /DNA_END=244 /DNA_ORIENTATION=-
MALFDSDQVDDPFLLAEDKAESSPQKGVPDVGGLATSELLVAETATSSQSWMPPMDAVERETRRLGWCGLHWE